MKTLIIEDEQFAVNKLKSLIHQYDSKIEILDQLDTVEDTVEWLSQNKPPDLIFLDIHLADGLSFEIFEQTEVNCPIIFTTAYDQYAIQAFKTKSVDYLLKPIKFEDLKIALDKFKDMFGIKPQKGLSEDMHALASLIQSQQKSYKTRFLVKAGNLIKTISITDVAYFITEDRSTLIVLKDKHRYVINYTLDELENMLDPHQFTRANRQFIINIDAIFKIHPWFKGRLKLELTPPQNIDLVISAEKTKPFKEWLDR